jgi:hypothetical protein
MMRRLLSSVLLILGLVVVTAGSAQAVDVIPGGLDCKSAPAAQLPGEGLPGFLDGRPNPLPAPGDPFTTHPTTSVYEQSGYAGLTWHTYDLGCGGDLRDVSAATDTMIGNWALSIATNTIAAANGLHNRLANPGTYMAPLNTVVAKVSGQVKTTIWNPWGAVALLAVAGSLLWLSMSGRMSAVAKGAAWAVLIIAIMSGLAAYPARASSAFDSTVTGVISTVNAGAAGIANLPTTSDPAKAQGALLVDRVLYDAWLRGQFGTTDSPTAKKWGPVLFKASVYSWDTAAQARADPAVAKRLADGKAAAWKLAAEQIQLQDPNAYLILQGKTGERAGVGVMTLFGALFTAGFRVIADLFMFAGLIMLRLLVMIFPAVAVLGVIAPMSSIVHRVANIAGASVVNVIAFSVGATIHTTIVSALLVNARLGGMNALVLVLCGVATVVAFVLLWPLLSLTNIVGMSSGGRGPGVRKMRKLATKYVPNVLAGAAGAAVVEAVTDEDKPKEDKPDPNTKQPAEAFGRPEQEPAMDEPKQSARAVGTPLYDPPRRERQPVDLTAESEKWVWDPDTKTVVNRGGQKVGL